MSFDCVFQSIVFINISSLQIRMNAAGILFRTWDARLL